MRKSILVLTSTFPRWEGDSTAPFVQLTAQEVEKRSEFYQYVLAPHSEGVKSHEELTNGIEVKRIRYGWPASIEKVFYDGGAANKGKSLLFMVLSLSYVISLFFNTLWYGKKRDVKIIQAHWIVPKGFVAVVVAKLLRKKSIVTVHGGDIFTMNGSIGKMLKKFVLKHADTVMVNSSLTKEAAQAIHDREYVFGPMGVITDSFSNKRKSTKLNKAKKIIFVGRVAKEKGVRYLLESLQLIDKEVTADIIGDGPAADDLKQQIKQQKLQKRATMVGWVDHKDIQKYFEKADVFVGPSITLNNGWREGMGLVYLEALFSGLPVITTNSTGAKDFVEDGVNGYVVDEKNPEQLAEAINKVLSGKIDQSKLESTVGNIIKKYSWDECSKRYIDEFNKLLGESWN